MPLSHHISLGFYRFTYALHYFDIRALLYYVLYKAVDICQ